ncbi:MAG: hypothetical protein ABH804_01770 [archaeon]
MGYKKTIIFLFIILIFLIGLFLFNLQKYSLTGKTIQDKYSYTKAICNDSNYCEDYEIICEENSLIRMNPTGAVIQHDENWYDPRDNETKEKLCE